jgi:hypothetical protein
VRACCLWWRDPAALEELGSVPPDPFTGRGFVYGLPGPSYRLYSVGPDGKDDGGSGITVYQMDGASRGDLVAGSLFRRRTEGQ